MKFVKLSLAAAMVMGASAYAIDDVKIDGHVKVWYQTSQNDKDGGPDLFDQAGAIGQAALNLGATAGLTEGMSGEFRVHALDTLGLESDVVSNVAAGRAQAAMPAGDNPLRTQWWVSDANVKYTVSNTTLVAGRQQLDTPLLYTEKWNAAYNTFDAAVLVNSDLPNTTLIAAYVGKHNGSENVYGTVNYDGIFQTAGTNLGLGGAAYAVAALINPMKSLNINAWYYDVNNAATAMWADAAYSEGGIFAGAQYAQIDPIEKVAPDTNSIMAVKLGYTFDGINVYGAYSQTNDDGSLAIANVSTGDKSKVYTASVWTDGAVVGTNDTTAFKLGVGKKFDAVGLSASYAMVSQGDKSNDRDVNEMDLVATGKVGPVALKGIFLTQNIDNKNSDDVNNMALRLIATVKF